MAEEEAMAAADVNGALIYTSHRRERLQQEDGRRANNFYLLDSLGGEHLAVVGEERDTRDGHYLYRAMPPFDVLHPATWGNATGVVEWLHSLLGQSVDDASVGVAAAPMDWQPTAAGEEKADQAQPPPPQRPKPARGLTVSGQPLDGWPPPPPPPRSQLALPAVPSVQLPKPPTQAPQKSAEGIRSDATVAHAAALGGLVARAEAEAAQRSAARRAAADWLRGELPADEADLLAANITGLAETLVEISALPRQSDAASGQLANGLHADGGPGQQPVSTAQPGDAEHLCNGVVSPEQEATQLLKLRVKRAWLVTEALDYLREVGSSYLPLRAQASAGVVPAVAAAAQHEDPAIALLAADYLSQLRTAAEAHLAVLASRKFSTDPRTALAMRLPAIVATADAIVEAEAAQASAVQRAAMAAAQAARPRPPQPSPQAGPVTRPAAPAAGQQAGASMDTRVDSSSAAQMPQPQDSEAEAASGFRHPNSPTIGGLDGVKLTTKPRTPHHKNLLARSAAMAGRKSGGSGVGTGPRPPRQPPTPTPAPADAGAAPPAALEAPAASGGAVSDGAPAASGAGSGGPSRPSTAGASAGDANAVNQWAPAEEQAIDLLDGEPDLGPLGNALKVVSKGTGCLQACRFAEVQGVVHAITATAQEQLQRHESWQSNAPFVRSVSEKVAGVQKEAARLSPEKAESTNRKAKQTIMKLLDALRATVEALSAKQAT